MSLTTQSPQRLTCWWCELDRESADDLREAAYDYYVGDER